MFKLTALISLMLIGTLWAAGLSCDSCGSECSSACGTRRFRSCCFNYLRKKRGPDAIKFFAPSHDMKETQSRPKPSMFIDEDITIPEQWLAHLLSNENHPYVAGDITENHMYEA